MSSFTKHDTPLRVLIATIAFGMGVNPPDVPCILQCGPPHDIELYVQEIGCGGRDGRITYATIFYAKSLKRFVEKSMVHYCEQNEHCRRNTLFHNFDLYQRADHNVGCQCCDVYKRSCICSDCNNCNVLLHSLTLGGRMRSRGLQ